MACGSALAGLAGRTKNVPRRRRAGTEEGAAPSNHGAPDGKRTLKNEKRKATRVGYIALNRTPLGDIPQHNATQSGLFPEDTCQVLAFYCTLASLRMYLHVIPGARRYVTHLSGFCFNKVS